jgi:hypothetical protein
MLKERIIDLEQLNQFIEDALPLSWDYDINPMDLELYFKEVRNSFIGR